MRITVTDPFAKCLVQQLLMTLVEDMSKESSPAHKLNGWLVLRKNNK